MTAMTGYDTRTLIELGKQLRALETPDSPFCGAGAREGCALGAT